MTAANHAATGAIIVLVIDKPQISLPLALVSHFVLDAIPHYDDKQRLPHESLAFLIRLAVDAAFAVSLLLLLALFLPTMWPLVAAGALLAMAPDLMWLPNYLRVVSKRPPRTKMNGIMNFHKHIQWFERPWGLPVEILWYLASVWLLLRLMFPHL